MAEQEQSQIPRRQRLKGENYEARNAEALRRRAIWLAGGNPDTDEAAPTTAPLAAPEDAPKKNDAAVDDDEG